MWRKGNPLILVVGMEAGTTTLENSMEVPPKLKIELCYNPAIVLLGIYPKEANSNPKGYLHPNVYSSNIHSSQTMKEPRWPLTDGHTMECYSVIREIKFFHLQ